MLLRISSLVLLLSTVLAGAGAAQTDPADAAWRAGDMARAGALYDARLARDSSDAVALQRVALIRAWSGRHDEGLALLDRLIRLEPDNVDAQVDRARVLALAGRFGEARGAYDVILARHPENARALAGLAQVSAWTGRLVEAERLYQSALERAPDDADIAVGLAQTLRWQGRHPGARTLLLGVLAREPQHADARAQLLEVDAFLRPRVSAGATHERDSDDNRVSTFSAGAAARVAARTELRADGYVRRAGVSSDVPPDATAYGGTLTLRQEVDPGFAVSASAGVVSSDVTDAEVLPVIALSLSTPARNAASLTVTAARTPFDATARLMERRVTIDELAAALGLRIHPATLRVDGSVARFRSRASGLENTRIAGGAALSRTVGAFNIALQARGFGFERQDIFDGYFAPDLYVLTELAAQYLDAQGTWQYMVELAPGVQKVGSGGDLDASLRAAGEVSWVALPGRSIVLRGGWANAGVNAVSPGAADSYEYRAITLAVRWRL